MSSDYFRFQIGSLECVALYDGFHNHKLQNMVTNAPRSEVEAALVAQGLPTQFIMTPYTSLLINTGVHRVLVDTGGGEVLETTGNLPNNLLKAGIEPESIDSIILTHAHPDHVGGLLDEKGELVFSRATYYLCKMEWNFWFSKDADIHPGGWMPDFARRKLMPVKAKTVLIELEGEILPGVKVLFSPGHTPGHMVVSFSSQNECLFYTGDVALHPIHLSHPGWIPVFDLFPETAATSRRSIFDLTAKTGCWVMGQQFPPFPSLGHVRKKENGWEWIPIE
jgi:glyoxylase-like metal-dependent hydrolase (beta-lactamase superfamily II)